MMSASTSDWQAFEAARVARAALAQRKPPLSFGRRLLLLALLTASFDIFLVLVIGGFTLRIHQVLVIGAILTASAVAYRSEKLNWPVGIVWLLIWTLCICAFVPNTVFLARSVGYAALLLLDVLIVCAVVQLFGNGQWIKTLLQGYLKVFVFIGCFGLLQLVLGALRLPSPFVQQWLIPGVWPRINGFSYEPSYYSTYMLMGWVFSAWLVEHKTYALGERLTKAALVVSTLAMLLATSRIGWAMMAVWGIGYVYRRLRRAEPLRFSPIGIMVGFTALSVGIIGVALNRSHIQEKLAFLAGGTGLYGTAAHSVLDREESLTSTLALVKESPFIGYSLGGVATAIGTMRGNSVVDNEQAKHNEGGTVFAEVLAASGVIGVIPFVLYLAATLRKPLQARRQTDSAGAQILSGLVWALCMELLILQFNQNILRAYLWFHMGVLAAAYAAVAKDKASFAPAAALGRKAAATS